MSNRGPAGWAGSPAAWPEQTNNLLIPKIQGYPTGRLKAANAAEQLLSTAVGWWDCTSGFKQGDRWLKNRGTGGEALDLRLGSSTTPNTNDPLFLEPDEQGYVYNAGANNYLTVPHSSALQITGDIDLAIKYRPDNDVWAKGGGGVSALIDKAQWSNTGNRQFSLYIDDNTGKLSLGWTTSGFTATTMGAASTVGVTGAGPLWVRATLDVNNGAGTPQYEVKFYTSVDGAAWVQLGATVTGSTGPTSISPGLGMFPLGIGQVVENPTGYNLTGKVYRVIIKNGIDGTTVLDIDCDRIKDGATESFPAITGQTVQIVRSTTGRKSVAMPAKRYGSRACMLLGADDYLEIPASITAQNFALSFGPNDNASFVANVRYPPNTELSNMVFIAKMPSVGGAGWQLTRSNNSVNIYAHMNDGVRSFATLSTACTYTQTANMLVSSVCDKMARTLTVKSDIATQVATGLQSLGSTFNELPTRVGAYSNNGAATTGMEFTAAAVFRRALTQRELQIINDYYTKPLNANAYPVQAPDAERKSYLASKLGVDIENPVLEVLKDAVFAIDAKAYDGASNYVENLGWGAELLNPRLGSTAAADTNDPKWLAPETSGYAYITGIVGNNLSTPFVSAYNGNDLDIRVKVAMDDWTPAAVCVLASTYDGTLAGRGWFFVLLPTGYLRFTPTLIADYPATVPVPFVDGSTWWVRVTRVQATGVIKFFYSADGLAWTQLGADVAGATTVLTDSTIPLRIGQYEAGSVSAIGKFYRAQVINAGTTIIDIDCNAITDGRQTSFLAATGQLVTVNRSTTGRKTVLMPSTTVKVMGEANVYLPGVVGNNLSVPDGAALTIASDIDLRVLVSLDAVLGAASYHPALDNSAYGMYLVTGQLVEMFWAYTSAATRTATSTVAVPFPVGTPVWLRSTLDVDNGAGQYAVTFYTSLDGSAWTQLGATVTGTTGVTQIVDKSNPLLIGQFNSGAAPPKAMRFYRAQVYNGIAGTKVLDIDCSAAVVGQSTFTALTGQTVTINSTANSGLRVNAQKVGAGHATWMFGTDDYMEVQGALQHDLLNFGAGESYSMFLVLRQWSTAVNGARYMQKFLTTGWAIDSSDTLNKARILVYGIGGASTSAALSAATPAGECSGIAVTYDGTQLTVSKPSIAAASATSVGAVSTATPMRVGSAAGTYFSDAEIMSAFIFRRALTADEITTLTNFYNG